ncbi:MAG: hypothetical protein R2809_08545 [Flavobacteriales bacterium]
MLFSFSSIHASDLEKVRIYLIQPHVKYKLARTIHNIKENYICYTEEFGNDAASLFGDFEDCIDKLKDQSKIARTSSLCYACAELCFKDKIVTVYFSREGDYFFEGEWHKRNNGLFYSLFSKFSSEYVLPEVLEAAEKCRYNNLWNTDDYLVCD